MSEANMKGNVILAGDEIAAGNGWRLRWPSTLMT